LRNLFNIVKHKGIKKYFLGTTAGLSANLFFYLWTNFGVWLLSGMYPKTTTGLLMSYVNALPFLRYQLISTLIFIPLGFFATEITILLINKYRCSNNIAAPLNINK
jgi:hypothetical protein